MHQRRWLFAFSIVSSIALALSAQEATPAPPLDPVQVAQDAKPGDTVKTPVHSSKWEYPKEVTVPQGSQLYFVAKGDTLWDLGQRFLGNPFAWPQIWEQNKWIKDPHWIYPLDPLVIPVAKQVVATGSTPAETPSEVADLQPDRIKPISRPSQEEYAFTFQDFIQLPYIARKGAEAHYKEVGALAITERKSMEKAFLGDGETVYLAGGADRGVKVGDRFVILKTVVQRLKQVDPKAKGVLGDVVQQVGVLRITQVNPTGSVAIIEKSMDSIEVGFRAVPFIEPAKIVTKLRTDVAGPVVPQEPISRIVFVRDTHEFTATGEMVIIDRGANQGLKVGDVLLVSRTKTWPGRDAERSKDRTTESTNYYVGQAIVVRTDPDTATCRVLRSNMEFLIGDIVAK